MIYANCYDMEPELKDFLHERGIDECIIKKIEDEKLDSSILCKIEDEALQKFIPKYGDRYAIIAFCMRMQKSNLNPARESLLDKLKRKMSDKSKRKRTNKSDDEPTCSQSNTKIVGKPTRIIELGWICDGVQVRTKCGGGTRRVSVLKSSTKKDILEKSINLFFPNGLSTKGSINDFNTDVLDFKRNYFDNKLNVQEIFNITELTTLRFYLSTESKECNSKENVSKPATEESVVTEIEQMENNFNMNDYLICFDNQGANETYIDFEPGVVTCVTDTNSDAYVRISPTTSFQEDLAEPQYNLTSENNVDFIITNSFEEPPEALFREHSSGDSQTLKVHRGRIFEEFLEAFQRNFFDNSNIRIEMILPNGEIEYAEDFGGVFRDALSEFWFTFYEKCTIGTSLKIPYLRHDFGELQWKAIAKVFIKGFETEKYIPIKLAPVFIQSCFGQSLENDEELLNNFSQYMCESEADVIKQALNDFEAVDNEELLDVLTNYGTKWAPTKNNFKQLLRDIAHTELVQKPAFVIKCFGQEFQNKASKINVIEVQNLYSANKPSVKNCLAKIDIQTEQDITPERTKVYGYLKRFIKEADEKTRTGFFRFCTGSDLPIRNISITFIDTIGIGRVPVAHTCTGLLELPGTYENFVVFRTEWNNLLNSNIWIMDII